MDFVLDFINRQVGEAGDLVFIIAIALGIFIFALGAMYLASAFGDPMRRRLRAAGGAQEDPTLGRRFADAVEPIAPYLTPKKEQERGRMTAKLIHAGYRGGNAMAVFYALKLMLALGLAAIVVLVAGLHPVFSTNEVIYFAIIAGFVGLMAPNIVLERRIEQRQRALRNGLPDALDLLVVCTEAGLGLNAAFQRVSRELAATHPSLAEEMALVNAEIRAGVDRSRALKNMATRSGLDDVRGLVSLLTQSLRFGTSIAESLRVYAEEFRDKRMQRAEEQAAKIGTKLIFPLVFCILPSFFLVAAGPAILRLVEVFSGR